VGHEEAVEFLDGEIGSAASQYDPGAAQVGFQFVESGFDLPALLIEGGEFVGRCGLGIEDGGDQPVERLGIFDTFELVVDDPDGDGIRAVRAILLARIDAAEPGTVIKALFDLKPDVLLDPPEQIGAGSGRFLPKSKAEGSVPVSCCSCYVLYRFGRTD